MTRETSIYLDLMRSAAAIAVFLDHVKAEYLTQGFLRPIGVYGEEAVAVFFVLSGIVVTHVVTARERSPSSYVIARLSRLWSVVVPAIVLTVLLDSVGARIDPGLYTIAGLPPPWRLDLASLWRGLAPILFLNQTVSPGTNGPFWSLCYEFWYYVGFGFVVFFRGWQRIVGLCAAAAIAGPHILLLSPLWIMGVVVRRTLGPRRASAWHWVGWVGSGIAMFALAVLKYRIGAALAPMLMDTAVPPSWLYGFITCLVAIPFAVNVFFFDAISGRFSRVTRVCAATVRAVAGRSFSLYLYQAPLLFFFAATTAHLAARPLRIAIVCGATLAAVIVLAEFTERRRPQLADWLRMLMGLRWGSGGGAPGHASGIPPHR